MKKLLLLTAAFSLQMSLYSQSVPNGTFEAWTSTPYDNPDDWESGNRESIPMMGLACISKVNGHTGFGVRMQTSIINGDTAYAYIAMGDPQGQGGVPYSQKPTAITGYYRYSLPGNDTALFMVIFKKNGIPVNYDLFKIKGTGNQSTFAPFSFPLTLSVIPDTVIVAAAASNLIDGIGVQHGSFLELDKLIFTGSGITQQIPNNEFENWTALSLDVPAGWESSEAGVSKTTSSYAGSYAVRLETTDSHGVDPAEITSGHMTANNGPQGGRPYNDVGNDTLCGYYKYTPMGGNTAEIRVQLTDNGNVVGGAQKYFAAAASSYTYFEIPFQSGFPTAADTIRIDLQSSPWNLSSANVGSVLYVDNLYLKSSALGVYEYANNLLESHTYPNPVTDRVNVTFAKSINRILDLFIYDETGRKIQASYYSRTSDSISINAENLESGVYFYEIRTSEGTMRNKFVKQ